jgi:AI-2 transport protein TqsA
MPAVVPECHIAAVTDLDAAAAEPRWLVPRGLIVVLAVTGLLVSVLAMREFASILGPVLLALILAMGVHPLTGILRRRGAPMWLAVTVTLVTLLGVILSLAASLALAVGQLATILPAYQDRFTALVNDLRAWLGSLGVGPDQLHAALDKIDFANVAAVVTALLAGLLSAFSNMLFLIFVVAFMALDAVGFSSRLARVRRQRPDVVGTLDTFVAGTGDALETTGRHRRGLGISVRTGTSIIRRADLPPPANRSRSSKRSSASTPKPARSRCRSPS